MNDLNQSEREFKYNLSVMLTRCNHVWIKHWIDIEHASNNQWRIYLIEKGYKEMIENEWNTI